ncbi:flagellar basal-body rod modification protein FlgD [Paraperlucidibaca baekdonensis]|uniref:Basal-body rod modification protein FlgD n=1 Tax=Paraperlucidibaca baekdonensis TaxID=748120 RepID=A0A3E0H1V1_9GAMM|nr:flagellar hook assembly protein FlgD [Paraperlucidibaca baekdonensis]REH36741.1 flagellar basal-body rod modification protein FlgD [Paraperlucidibaca baekdonensis]
MDFSQINSVVNPGATAAAGGSESRKTLSDLDQGDFMTLMLAQMQAQDPLKPTDNTQFMAQMAQLSSVAGINDMKESISDLANSMSSSQWLNASGLIGKTVLVPSETVGLSQGTPITGQVSLDTSAQNVRVDILTKSGELVRQVNLGAQPAGTLNFQWDGTDNNNLALPNGNYTLKATAIRGSTSEALPTSVQATVGSVSMSGGSTQLDLGPMGNVKLSDVKAVG